MAGLCEGGNEPPGSLKAICNFSFVNFHPDQEIARAGHIVRMEKGRIPRRTLEGQYGGKRPVGRPWNRGRIWFKKILPVCCDFGTGRWQQRTEKNGEDELGRPWPENGLKSHR
ncbi:hypothetical protein ANN_16089 [Periplaneta americana]|uniref:Uncharacterized protein n=1 Tax=Periplaneta americana TaxID=6978 RepID=A0ABQ8SJD5_PERAM|nr:hypothetical protein ANN_16089 [Periplaneta americana]